MGNGDPPSPGQAASSPDDDPTVRAAKVTAAGAVKAARMTTLAAVVISGLSVTGTFLISRDQLGEITKARDELVVAKAALEMAADNVGHAKWDLAFGLDFEGNIIAGDRGKLLEQVRRGCPVRVTFSTTYPDRSGMYYFDPGVLFVYGQDVYALANVPQVAEVGVGVSNAKMDPGTDIRPIISTNSNNSFEAKSDTPTPRKTLWFTSCAA